MYRSSDPESFGRPASAGGDVYCVGPDVDQCRERSAHASLFAFPAVGACGHAVGGHAEYDRVPFAVEHRNTLHLNHLQMYG